MMKRQLELRKEETRAIHESVHSPFPPSQLSFIVIRDTYRKCDSLEAQLSRLRDMAKKKSEQIPKQVFVSR